MTPLELLELSVTRLAPKGTTSMEVLVDIHEYGPDRLKPDGYRVDWLSDVATNDGTARLAKYVGGDTSFCILTLSNGIDTVHHCIPGSDSATEVMHASRAHFLDTVGPFTQPVAAVLGESLAKFIQRTF